MPSRIGRDEAFARVESMVPPSTCPMCWLATRTKPLATNESALLTLNAFPLRWGHMLVLLRRHVTTFGALSEREHRGANELVHLAARAVERVFSPPRVFTASLGTAVDGLKMTTPHLHWHVVPIATSEERPSEVLTWQHGVFAGTDEEWGALENELGAALREARS